MKKLIFVIVMFFMFQITSHAGIVEKNNQRYFKLGDQEYVCNADNRISDESARDILKRVRKIYDSKLSTATDNKIIEDIWSSLHKVYSGDAYDEILFICLRLRLNYLFSYLEKPSEKKEGESHLGKILFVYEPDFTVSVKEFHPSVYTYYVYKVYASILEQPRFVMIENEKNSAVSKSDFPSGRAMRSAGANSFSRTREAMFSEVREYVKKEAIKDAKQALDKYDISKIQTKAKDAFVNRMKELLDYWSTKADSDSYILEDQWDNLIVQIPKAILSMENSCGKETSMYLAGRMVGICLEYAQGEDAKNAIISFAKKNKLEFVIPKAKEEEKNIKLF